MFYPVFLLMGTFAFCAMADYAQEALDAHNSYRRIHDAQPLSLSKRLSKSAARYARKLARMGYLKHSPKKSRPGVGENLIYRCSSRGDPLPASQAVKDLYDEVCLYNFNRPGFDKKTGHFTQLVWKGSSKLGVGTATSRKRGMNCLWVVFRYRKSGNVKDQYEANVVRGSFDRRYCNRDEERDQRVLESKVVKEKEFKLRRTVGLNLQIEQANNAHELVVDNFLSNAGISSLLCSRFRCRHAKRFA